MKQMVMDQTGHSTFGNVSLDEAEKRFNDLTKQGYRAATGAPGEDKKIVKKFDPTAEEMIFIPALQGG